MKPLLCCLAASLAMTLSQAFSLAAPGPVPNHLTRTYRFTQTNTHTLNYLLYLPEGYEAAKDKTWPLVLFLHGAGERGTNIGRVAIHGPPKLVAGGKPLPFIVVSPQCPEGQRWANEPLLGLLDEVCAQYRVDTRRIYLTGLSMGGFGTWNLGVSFPDRFAAIAPICGGGETIAVFLSGHGKGEALRSLGVWAFHGAKDPVVRLEESERMVNALKKAGVRDLKLTVYPEAEHDSWTETYNNPELFEWFLKHRR